MSQQSNPLRETLDQYLAGQRMQFDENDMRSNPAGYALLSKLVRDEQVESFDNEGNLAKTTPNLDYLLGLSGEKAQEIDDNEAIMQLLPDLERTAQILISFIKSPTYLTTSELNYFPPKGLFTLNVGQQLVDTVRQHVRRTYDIESRLYDILYKVLFTKGSFCLACIPESSLDEIINADIAQETFSMKIDDWSLEEIEQAIATPYRPAGGFISYGDEAKLTPKIAREHFMYNGTTVSVGHGEGETPKQKEAPKLYDIRLKTPEQIEYTLPKELFHVFNENDSVAHLSLSKEDHTWTPSFDVNTTDSMVEFTDDLSLLRLARARNQALERRKLERLGLSTESYRRNQITDREIMNRIFKSIDSYAQRNNAQAHTNMKYMKTTSQTVRENLSEPLVLEYPSEAIIPIFKPSSPSEHIGYLALHDEEGAPLSKIKPVNYYRELSNQYNIRTGGNMASSLIQQGRAMFDGFNGIIDEARQLEMLSRIHGNAIIREMANRIREGENGKNIDMGDATEAYRIMFYRALRGQRTRILFIPKEIMTYIAVDHDAKGMGTSLVDNMKVLLSLRIQYLLAQTRAGIANSIPETVATLKIDERDPDPKKTIQIAQALILQSRQNAGLLVGASNVQTIEDRINQSNIRIAIESDHPGIPNIGHDVSRNTADIPTPDTETGDAITKMSRQGFYLPPELVDNSYSPDFSSQVMQQNFLVGLIVTQLQGKFNPHFTDITKKLILASPSIRKELNRTISASIKEVMELIAESSGDRIDISTLTKEEIQTVVEYLVDKFIAGLEVALPEPVDNSDESKNDQISKMEARIDKILDYTFSQDALPASIIGETASNFVDQYRGMVKADIMSKYLLELDYGNNVMDYISIADDGKQTFEANQEIRQRLIQSAKNIAEMFKEGDNIARTVEAVLSANEITADNAGGGDYSSDSDSDSDDSGGDDGGFGDMFGGGDEGEEGGEEGSGDDDTPGWETNEGDDGEAD